MQGALKALLTSLQGSRDGVLPSIQAFPPPDCDQLARELALDERAKETGAQEKPPSDATIPDLAERQCLAEIERRAQKSFEEYTSQLNLYDNRIRRVLLALDQRVEVEVAGQNALSNFRVQCMDDLEHLFTAQREVEGREAEFEAFRRENELTRLPKIVTGRARFLGAMIIGILIVIESWLNGSFFAEGSEAGLVGGFTQALMFSLLNIGAAVGFAVYGLPQLIHRRPIRRLVGVMFLLAYVALAFELNLLIAHFRDVFIASAGQVETNLLLKRLTEAPFALDDAKSWLLAVFGMALSVLAVIDAASLDDLYWGYGAVGRRREEAIAAYAHQKTDCLRGLQERRDECTQAMTEVIRTVRSLEFEMRLAREGRAELHKNLKAHFDHLATCYQNLTLRYREANERARKTPAPAYFRQLPQRPAFLQVPALPDVPQLADESRELIIDRMEYYIRAVNAEFAERAEAYDTLSVLTRRQEEANAAA